MHVDQHAGAGQPSGQAQQAGADQGHQRNERGVNVHQLGVTRGPPDPAGVGQRAGDVGPGQPPSVAIALSVEVEQPQMVPRTQIAPEQVDEKRRDAASVRWTFSHQHDPGEAATRPLGARDSCASLHADGPFAGR